MRAFVHISVSVIAIFALHRVATLSQRVNLRKLPLLKTEMHEAGTDSCPGDSAEGRSNDSESAPFMERIMRRERGPRTSSSPLRPMSRTRSDDSDCLALTRIRSDSAGTSSLWPCSPTTSPSFPTCSAGSSSGTKRADKE